MIRLIAAIDRRRGIGKNGGQPWYIPEDEAYFARLTKQYGGIVLVGSATFRTFRGPLKDRDNYVLTRHDTPIAGAHVVHDLDAFLEEFRGKDVWVIGGGEVFARVLRAGLADELYLTHIDADFGCDKFFPEYAAEFTPRGQSEARGQNGFRFSFAVYVKATS